MGNSSPDDANLTKTRNILHIFFALKISNKRQKKKMDKAKRDTCVNIQHMLYIKLREKTEMLLKK